MGEGKAGIITPEHIMWHVDRLRYRTNVLGRSVYCDFINNKGNVVQLVWNKYMRVLLTAVKESVSEASLHPMENSLSREALLRRCQRLKLYNPMFSKYLKNAKDCGLVERSRDRHDVKHELSCYGTKFLTDYS